MNDQDNTQFNFVSRLVRNKSSVDGHEIEHVFYIAGGFGESTEDGESPQRGKGGGGVAIPLGAYVSDGGTIRFRPNKTVLFALGVPIFTAGARVARQMLKVLEKKE